MMNVNANWSRYRNYEFIQFFSHLVVLAETHDLAALQLKTHLEGLKPPLAQLEEVYSKQMGNLLTKKLEELDAKRDKLVIFFRKIVEAHKYHIDERKNKAAEEIEFLIEQYGGSIDRLPYAQETLAIRKLHDSLLSDNSLSHALDKLELRNWLTLMQTANEDFQSLFVGRTMDNADTVDVNTGEVRKLLATMFEEFADRLKAHAILTESAEHIKLLNRVNQLVSKTNRTASARGNKDKDEAIQEA